MFERYTERARRALFFARYEATQTRSRSIEPAHLLLGLLREGQGLARVVFSRAGVSLLTLRDAVVASMPGGDAVPTSVEIPFNSEAKDVLMRAAEEADALKHHYIGPEHLLLGILRNTSSTVSSLLADRGISLDGARTTIVTFTNSPAASGESPTRAVRVSLSAVNVNNDVAPIAAPGALRGFTLKAAVAHLHAMPASRVVWPAALNDNRPFDFAVPRADRTSQDEALDQVLCDGIQLHYELETRREVRLVDAYVLTTPDGSIRADRQPGPGRTFVLASSVEIGLAHDADDETSGPDSLSGTVSMPLLCSTLEHLLGRPVADETQLDGWFKIVVQITGAQPEAVIDALREQLNLTLAPVQREFEMLVVERRR